MSALRVAQPAVHREALKAVYPWAGDADRFLSGAGGWDVIVTSRLRWDQIAVDVERVRILVGEVGHLRYLLDLEHERTLARQHVAAGFRETEARLGLDRAGRFAAAARRAGASAARLAEVLAAANRRRPG